MWSSGFRWQGFSIAACALGIACGCSEQSRDHWAKVETCDLQIEIRDRSARLGAAAGSRSSDSGVAHQSAEPPRGGDRGEVHVAPGGRTACPAAAEKPAAPSPLAAAVRPVIVAARAADDAEVRLAARQLRTGLETAQDWVGDTVAARSGLRRSFDLDRPVILRRSAAELSGDARELVRSLIAAGAIGSRQQVVALVGGGPTWIELRSPDGTPAGLIIGDAILSALARPDDTRQGAAAAIALTLLGQSDRASDRSIVRAASHARVAAPGGGLLTGLWPSLASGAPRVSDEVAAKLDAAVTLSGTLVSGHVVTSTDAEMVADIAAGEAGALVLWHQPTGLGTQPLADGTPSGFDTAVGLQHTRLVASVVRTDGGPYVQAPVTLSRPPAPTALARRVDGSAAAAFDGRRGEYQVVWSRRFARGDSIVAQLMGVRVTAGGTLRGSERVLATLDDAADVQIDYDEASDTFALAWASHQRGRPDGRAAPLELAILSGDGDVMGEPVMVAENARRPALVAGKDGYLLSWTKDGEVGSELISARVSADGDIGARYTILRGRGVGLGSAAWDASAGHFRVAVHQTASDGTYELAASSIDDSGASADPHRLRRDVMLYDPAIAAVAGASVIAAATEDGRFFDGVGGLWAELEAVDGSSVEVILPRDDASYANIEMASDDRLIYIATSGESGVRVDLVDVLDSYGAAPERLVGMR